jgi:serine/threonine protein kinase
MADPRTDPPSRSRRRPTPRPSPGTEDAILGDAAPSTDDSPTVISRNNPRVEEGGGVRGRRLAHFELIEPIGVGGMAAVIRARDTQLDRMVALKILPPELAADPENVRRFHQEARSAAKLDHENIARVFFCGEDQRLHFIAFEFVEGDNLRTLLEKRGRLPVAEALTYMIQVAAGLCHAAERGVVHRDIKPSNIIITPNGRAKLVDMGLARSLEPRSEHDLTQSGVTLGTFDYISPEQALEPRDADVRSDIYSLGCTFYHCLTGRPPVPEGTAAKKLHHHQHVKPLDPRVAAPDLPDQVALILDRMMAKKAKDRFQTPADLVQHLLQAARQLGAAPAAAGTGVVSVETSLPNPPGARPLVLAALAAAVVVVGLILFFQQSGGPSPPKGKSDPGKPAKNDARQAADRSDPAPDGPPRVDGRVKDQGAAAPADDGKLVTYDADNLSAADLREFLKKHGSPNARLLILLSRDLDLSSDRESASDPGLKVLASHVTIQPKIKGTRPTIRLSNEGGAAAEGQLRWAALTLDAADVEVQGLRFVLDAEERDIREPLVALLTRGGRARVSDCEFLQARPAREKERERRPLQSVVSEGRSRDSLTLSQCRFVGFRSFSPNKDNDKLTFVGGDAGQEALVRRGAATLTLDNCVFGPHVAAVTLEGSGAVKVRHCTALVGPGSAVFAARDGAAGQLDVEASLFGHAGGEGDACLIRQVGEAGALIYKGNRNRYSGLDSYWSAGPEKMDDPWAAFEAKLKQVDGADDSPPPLETSPWKSDPAPEKWTLTYHFDTSQPPPEARDEDRQLPPLFQVKDNLSELRLPPDKGALVGLVGAQHLGEFSFLEGVPRDPLLARPPRLVDPTISESGGGKYRTLEEAVLAAKPGDVIEIKHTGELLVKPLSLGLEEAAVDLTIRPAAGSHPVLTLGNTPDRDAALIVLHAGKARLEGLEFLLRPRRDEFTSQAVVALVGGDGCSFKDCLLTLDQGDRKKVRLTAATVGVAGPDKMMDPRPGKPPAVGKLSFENCFVRGEGDLVWSRTARPFELRASNSAAALTGCLLQFDVADAAPGGSVNVDLTKVTTYLGGHLVRFNAGAAKDLKDLAPVHLHPDGCLFLSAPGGKSLVHLDGPETEKDKLKERLVWQSGVNGYGAFDRMFFDQQTPDGGSVMQAMDADAWKRFAGEDQSKFGLKLASGPAADAAYPRLTPDLFRPAEAGFGADAADLLKKLFPPADARE